MTTTVTLPAQRAALRLQRFVDAARRIDDGSMRVVVGGGVLGAYCVAVHPVSILDDNPTVLGVEKLVVEASTPVDAIVPLRSFSDRLARGIAQSGGADDPVHLTLPMTAPSITWSTIRLPKVRWRKAATVEAGRLRFDGDPAAHVDGWGAGLPGLEFLPVGAAFAATRFEFLQGDDEAVVVHEGGPWLRLALRAGDVLVRRRNWSIKQ